MPDKKLQRPPAAAGLAIAIDYHAKRKAKGQLPRLQNDLKGAAQRFFRYRGCIS